MHLDDEVCLCFHVTKRKLQNYIRIERPKRVAQLSDCFGAGTGCGWCRGYMRRMFEAHQQGVPFDEPSTDEHVQGRVKYVRSGGGTPPPGATPVGE